MKKLVFCLKQLDDGEERLARGILEKFKGLMTPFCCVLRFRLNILFKINFMMNLEYFEYFKGILKQN